VHKDIAEYLISAFKEVTEKQSSKDMSTHKRPLQDIVNFLMKFMSKNLPFAHQILSSIHKH
jgi:hypothetical protein